MVQFEGRTTVSWLGNWGKPTELIFDELSFLRTAGNDRREIVRILGGYEPNAGTTSKPHRRD